MVVVNTGVTGQRGAPPSTAAPVTGAPPPTTVRRLAGGRNTAVDRY
ncbi:hypothetical protein A2U01_0058489, partial [Trifolium medium]|nr:hypothetical protein [Trifolium medium]